MQRQVGGWYQSLPSPRTAKAPKSTTSPTNRPMYAGVHRLNLLLLCWKTRKMIHSTTTATICNHKTSLFLLRVYSEGKQPTGCSCCFLVDITVRVTLASHQWRLMDCKKDVLTCRHLLLCIGHPAPLFYIFLYSEEDRCHTALKAKYKLYAMCRKLAIP